MKLIIVLAAFAVGQASLLTHLYVPMSARSSKNVHILNKHFIRSPIYHPHAQAQNTKDHPSFPGSNAYGRNGKPSFVERLQVVQAARERYASKLLQDSLNDTMPNTYENKNGINAEEAEVATNDVQNHIGYYYVGDDGKVYYLRYLADIMSSYAPQGDITSTPAPMSANFMKGLEKLGRAHISDSTNKEAKTGLCHENKCDHGRVYSGHIFNRNSIFKKIFYPSNKFNPSIEH